jgi:RND superfamily putative drug exporter
MSVTSTARGRQDGGDPAAAPEQAPRPGPLGRLARVAFRRRGRTVLAWVLVLVLAGVLSTAFGGDFKADYSAPGSDSKAAQDLLEQRFPAQSGATVDVVVHADGSVTSPAVRADVDALLARLDGVPHVASVDDPYTTPGGVSADGRTLLTTAHLDVTNPVDMPVADSQQMLDLAAGSAVAARDGVSVALGGQSVQQAEQGAIGSEGIGIAAAALILLLTFGSVVAAGLPILVAVAGLAVSSLLTGLLLAFIDAPDWSTSLATMMGIGIGIDYALLMVTRFREWRAVGLDPERATVATLDTAGRSVIVAGSTVLISMFGLFAMGLSFMRGAATSTGGACRSASGLPPPLPSVATSSPHVAGWRGAGWSSATASPPRSPASRSCSRWRRRSSGCASASPTPATTRRGRPPERPTT